MHRDTDMARWYRRVDRRCFTGQRPTDAEGTRDPAANTASRQRTTRENPVLAGTAAPTGWRALVNDRRIWTIEAVADRL